MFALAATLRPSVIAPQTGACALLSELKPSERLGPLYRFANAVAMDSQKLQGVRIDSTVLRGASSETAWTDQREQLVVEVDDWRQRALHMTIKYAPATTVWQRWLNSGGAIDEILKLIVADTTDEPAMEHLIVTLESKKRFNDLVKETDSNQTGRRKGRDIHARALTQLYDHAQQAVSFARRHLSLRQSRPSQSNYITQALTDLRTSAASLGPPASDDLSALAASEKSILSAAANTAAYAVERFRELLDHPIAEEPDPHELYASGLFGYPEIPIDDHGVPACGDRKALDLILSSEAHPLTTSFDVRLQNADFHTASRIIEWIEYGSVDEDDTSDLRGRLEAALDHANRQLRHEIDDTRAKLERARALGHVSPTERDNHDADLVDMERRVALRTPDYLSERSKIRSIDNKIDRALDVQRRMATETLSGLKTPRASDAYRTIAKTIERGDIVTANELIDRVRSGDASSSPDQPIEQSEPFRDFYPAQAVAIEDALEGSNPRTVGDRIVRGDSFGGMAFGSIPGSQRQSAKKMLDAWFDLKRSARLSTPARESLRTVFSELGFIVRKVTIRRDDRNFGEALVVTVPLADRERCPVPAFGSFVNGHYRVVCLWGRPTEEDILQHAEDGTRKTATIVLYFGRLTKPRRENLGVLSRRRSQTLIVVDEVLLVFLCGQRGSRTRILFSARFRFHTLNPM